MTQRELMRKITRLEAEVIDLEQIHDFIVEAGVDMNCCTDDTEAVVNKLLSRLNKKVAKKKKAYRDQAGW